MKKIFGLFLLVTFSINAQTRQLEAIKLKEGSEKEYLETEKFWEKVKKFSFKLEKKRIGTR